MSHVWTIQGCQKFIACTVVLIGGLLLQQGSTSKAAVAVPVVTDLNAEGLGFDIINAFAFGIYTQDDGASFSGNNILVQSQNGTPSGGAGAGVSASVSNGENGIDSSFDGVSNEFLNEDIPNDTSPNPVFAEIGNAVVNDPLHGGVAKLQNGNVVRFSLWIREDPNDPITVAPQIEPVFKFEFWKEALSDNADTNPGAQPLFGDKIVDTDQHLGQGIWIDLDNNGSVIDALAAFDGRIRTISSDHWTLVEVLYEVDDSEWFGIDDDVYTVEDVEEIRGVMFWGDFTEGTTLEGSLWLDNLKMEVFADADAVTPNTNPDPALSEVTESADFDGDGDVDGSDFLAWQRGLGTGTQHFEGDANFDGTVNGADLTIWENEFGNGGLAAVRAVPEPGSLALILSCVMALVCARRLS